MWGVLVAVLAAALGAGVGTAIRSLLGRLGRGMTLSRGWPELACAAVTVAGAATSWGTARLPLVLYAGVLAIALAPVDWRHHRLPDAITLPAIPMAAAIIAIVALVMPGSGSVARAIAAAAAAWAIFAAVAWISPRSMGRGDVKLVPTLTLLTGFLSVAAPVMFIALAFVLGAVAAVTGLAAGRLKLRSAIPFGPCLLVGAWLVLAFPGLSQLLC